MRICHYPGRVVDATLSLDQKSPMETLYQNNWLNADKTIKTIGRNSVAIQRNERLFCDTTQSPNGQYRNEPLDRKYFSQSSGSSGPQSSSDDENRRTSISSLGRYQMTLEEMQKLDLNQPNELFRKTMRNLNGYKPSTIRQKHRRNYDGWDEVKDKTIDEESKNNHNGDWQSNGNYKYGALENNQVVLIPKIKRSQTMRYSSSNGNSKPETLNIRNVFNQQQLAQHQNHEEKITKMPTATINKNFNRFKRSNLLSIQNGLNNVTGDIKSNQNGSNGNANELIIPSNFSQFTMKSNGNIKIEQKPNGICDNDASNATNGKTKKKPLFRAKSVRINPTPLQDVYFDRMHATDARNGTNSMPNNCDKRHSAPVNVQKQQILPRLTSIMKKKPIVIPEQCPEVKPILDQWINLQEKQKKEQPTDNKQKQKSSANHTKDENLSSTSSLSSISSSCGDCNSNVSDFSIPRPRLIVPVHTYARKRRTGNLIQSQTGDCDHDAVVIEQPRNSRYRKNGKTQLKCLQTKLLFLLSHSESESNSMPFINIR